MNNLVGKHATFYPNVDDVVGCLANPGATLYIGEVIKALPVKDKRRSWTIIVKGINTGNTLTIDSTDHYAQFHDSIEDAREYRERHKCYPVHLSI